MPTVALINGHAFAGGFMLATAQDYRLAPSPRGFLCVNEVLFGAPLKPAMSALFRTKYPATTYRNLVLEARRYSSADAVEAGIADGVAAGVQDLLDFVDAKDLTSKPKSGVYGVLKTEMYHGLVDFLKSPGMELQEARFDDTQAGESDRLEFGKVWYEQWLKDKETKAKL